jgi:hypothetical protein
LALKQFSRGKSIAAASVMGMALRCAEAHGSQAFIKICRSCSIPCALYKSDICG